MLGEMHVPVFSAIARPICRPERHAFLLLLSSLCLLPTATAQSDGALGNGLSAGATARGGVVAVTAGDPLDAVQGNPAGLAAIRTRVLNLSGVGVLASGSFRNSVDPHGTLSREAGALPYGAFALPLGNSPWSASVAVTPELLMRANWHYIDPAGTAGATYGEQSNESRIVGLRSSIGVARTFGSRWSAGATVGLVYNSNTLHAPYIFQQQAALAGLKVLLDLNTSGFGWNGSAGAQWQANSRLRFGASWKSGTAVNSRGIASGTASAQFQALGIAADPTFHYRAEVDNHLPQSAAFGASWRSSKRLQWLAEGDWVNWSRAFHRLPVKLTEGSNATINSVVGGNAFEDGVPLHWRDQGILRVGVETPLSESWKGRAGYSYMSNPVPSATLTPLTAAILSNTFAAGAGWNRRRWTVDGAYQLQLPASQSVGQSDLRAGEYNNSHVKVMTQSLSSSVRLSF